MSVVYSKLAVGSHAIMRIGDVARIDYHGDNISGVKQYMCRFGSKITSDDVTWLLHDFQWDVFQFHMDEYVSTYGGLTVVMDGDNV